MSRQHSPKSDPQELPVPNDEDLNFADPPGYLKNPFVRTFWCINKNVREKIMQNRPRVVFFCFHKGYCTFQVDSDPNVAKGRIENHFYKNPHHRISAKDLGAWEILAKERQEMRDARKNHSDTYARSPFDRNLHRGGSRSPSRYPRERSPSRSHNRSPRDGGGRDWGRMRSPPYSNYQEGSPSTAYRRGDHSTSYRYRSPSPSYRRRDRSQSPRYRSQSPSYGRRERSHSPSIRGGPKSPEMWTGERPKSPKYTERSWSPNGQKGAWQSNSRPSPPLRQKHPSYPIKKTYSSVPGAIGRFNSRKNGDQTKTEQERNEYICQPRGSRPGCTKIFYDQEEYIEHIKQRNIHKKCPEDPSMTKWICHSLGSLPGCQKVFHVKEEYEDHIRERNKTKTCPSVSNKTSSPRARSPSFDRKKVKHEDTLLIPLYKGPVKEITLDDSPPYIPALSPDPDISVMEIFADSPPASPPHLESSSSINVAGAASPPPSNRDSVKIRDDGVLLIEPQNESTAKITSFENPNMPKIKISNNLFSCPVENTESLKSPVINDPVKRYPSVQRSPTSSPERSSSNLNIKNPIIKHSQSNLVSSVSLMMKSPSQISILKYPTVQRSPSYSSPGKSPIYQRSPSHLNVNISPKHDKLKSPSDIGSSPRDPRLLRSPKTGGISPLTSPSSSIPLPSLLTQKPATALPNLQQELTGKEQIIQNYQELYEQLCSLRNKAQSDWKSREQTRLIKDAKDIIKAMTDKENTTGYNSLIQLVKEMEGGNVKTKPKETDTQLKTKLPSFMTAVEEVSEVREVEAMNRENQLKTQENEMEMLLDKKKRAHFLKEQTKLGPASFLEKSNVKQSQQKLGEIYQNLIAMEESKVSNKNKEDFNILLNEANIIMMHVKETKEYIRDVKLYDMMCTRIKTMKVDKIETTIETNMEKKKAEAISKLGPTPLLAKENQKENIIKKPTLHKDVTNKLLGKDKVTQDKNEARTNNPVQLDKEGDVLKMNSKQLQKLNEVGKNKSSENKIKEGKSNNDNMSSFESAMLQPEETLKQKKESKKRKSETLDKSQKPEERLYKDKIKETQTINEGENSTKTNKSKKRKKSKDEKLSPKKEKTFSKGSSKTTKIGQENVDQVSLSSDDFACSNCEKTFTDPSTLANHTLACKQTRVEDNVEMEMAVTVSEDIQIKNCEEKSVEKNKTKSVESAFIPSVEIHHQDVSEDEYCGEVLSLKKALGGTSDSETEEDEDETIILQNGIDQCIIAQNARQS